MAYTKHTWVTGETITAANLNHLEDGVVVVSANGAIDTANLADGAVTTAKLAANSVTSAKIANNSITEDELADGAVTNTKLDQEAVDSDNIRNGAIITPLIYDGAVTIPKLGADVIAELDNKANIDGSYEGMTVGNAEQLISSVGIEDQTPYNFRTSGGSAEIGDREELNAVVGVSVPWNQLVKDDTDGWANTAVTSSVSDGEVTVTSTTDTATPKWRAFKPTLNRVYLFGCDYKSDGTAEIGVGFYSSTGSGYKTNGYSATEAYTHFETMYKPTAINDIVALRLRNATASGGYGKFKNIVLFDLTFILGSTIAGYIYALEQSNAGSGVAYFRKLFPKLYYAYNSGEMLSVRTNLHKMAGFNQWDEQWESGYFDSNGVKTANASYIRSKNYIPCFPSTVYYFKRALPRTNDYRFLYYYDKDHNFISSYSSGTVNATITTPANAYYMMFAVQATTYLSGICINLHWDGERDGEYEPYVAHEYAMSDITLRGILRLDANNNLYADGDRYLPDGTVERRYKYLDLGTLAWTKSSSGNKFTGTIPSADSYVFNANQIMVCAKYAFDGAGNSARGYYGDDKTIRYYNGLNGHEVYVHDENYTDAAAFKTAMDGVYLVYELATPTTETASPYQRTQIVDDFGTEEFVDAAVEAGERDVAIPVGNETVYKPNLRAKLEMAPDSPDGDGDYIVRQMNGTNEYVNLSDNGIISGLTTRCPACPTDTDGTFVLKATVSGGAVTYSWVSE